MRNTLLSIVPLIVLVFPGALHAAAPGFTLLEDEGGVALWQKRNDYIQIVSLHDGAEIHLLRGGKYRTKRSNEHFNRLALDAWWQAYKVKQPNLVSMANGQFFNPKRSHIAPLAFSTKMRGRVYPGYGDKHEFRRKKLLLRIGKHGAVMQRYNDNHRTLSRLPEKDIIVGLDPSVDKAARYRKRRTFIGVLKNGDVAIFTSPAASQRIATRMLQAFGAKRNSIMMLDGGGSTQFVHAGDIRIPVGATYLRPVPQAIAVVKNGS